jgi:hypothetical protein
MLYSIHKSIITSQRRNVLFFMKDITFLSASSSPLPHSLRPCHISSFRWFSSFSDDRTKDETIITTSHGINTEPPQQLLPTKRSGRKRSNPQELRDHTPPLLTETLEAASFVMEDTWPTARIGVDMSVTDDEEDFSQVQGEQRRRLDVAIVGLPNAGTMLVPTPLRSPLLSDRIS